MQADKNKLIQLELSKQRLERLKHLENQVENILKNINNASTTCDENVSIFERTDNRLDNVNDQVDEAADNLSKFRKKTSKKRKLKAWLVAGGLALVNILILIV